ncbi:hypothetical protein MOTE_10620 [Moorella thermoacetica]|uniref:Uncharacterized protein n=1 Tax=Neomoorella thermoacetica TaxID=1525 RepID=A0A1J5NMH0_NEOTH|nr:hypothetical protein MOTE_10620 [Moorella thermoacetica]
MIRYNLPGNSKPDGYRPLGSPSVRPPVRPDRGKHFSPGNAYKPSRPPARPGGGPADREPPCPDGGVFHARVSTATDPGKAAGSVVKALLSGHQAADATASGGAVEKLGRALSIAQKFASAHGKRLQVRAEISFVEEKEN